VGKTKQRAGLWSALNNFTEEFQVRLIQMRVRHLSGRGLVGKTEGRRQIWWPMDW
jgi:hypothetical protein